MPRARPSSASRPLTLLAFGFLAIDAILLMLAGLWSDRVVLVILGVVFAVAAIGVLLYWRAHQRQLEEIAKARADLKAEAEAMRELIKKK
jgi:Tfp pilus assembly protein PilO